jgi:hypothetical protein
MNAAPISALLDQDDDAAALGVHLAGESFETGQLALPA